MKKLRCPANGLRDIGEFTWLGWVAPAPDPAMADDATWAAYLFDGPPPNQTVRLEWWLHRASGYVLVARRDIVADTILATFDPAELPPELRDRIPAP